MNPDLISNSQIILVRNLGAIHAPARYRKRSTSRDQRGRGQFYARALRAQNCIEFFARPAGENSRGDHSPSLSPLPPTCLTLATTALTSISLDFLSVSAAAATSASLRAVVSAAGSSVAPVSTGA